MRTQQVPVDPQSVLDADVVERSLGPDEVEALECLVRPSDVANKRPNPVRETALGYRCPQPLDARSVTVYGDNGAGGELGEVERLPADAAAKVEHHR